MRVQNGGHSVPDEDVIRRFGRSRTNFWNIYKDKVDMWLLVYNGENTVFPVAMATTNFANKMIRIANRAVQKA